MQFNREDLRRVFSRSQAWQAWGLSVLLIAVSASGARAQASGETNIPPSSANAPRIQLAEDFFDFGRVEAGKLVKHDFAFTNAGNQVLEIQDIVTSCGCTTVGEWNRRVEPGKSGIIPVELNTAGLTGPTLKNIKLTCNDPAQPKLALYVKVSAYKQIDALPQVAGFAFGPDFQTNLTRSIWITNHMDEAVTLEKPVLTNDTFKAELKTILEGKVFQLLVSVVPPAPEGSLAVPITLKTSSPKMPEVSVSAYAMVQPSISLSPPRVFLETGPLKEPASFTITVRNQSTNALQLSNPVITGQGAGVKLVETEPGRTFALTLTFPAGFRIPKNETVEARVKSNRAAKPWIIVPVVQPDNGDDADTSGPGSSPAAQANAGQQAGEKAAEPHPASSRPSAASGK